MPSRNDLQQLLEKLLGSRNVYYQTPESVKMEYPAIRYSRDDVDTRFANNKPYSHKNKYRIVVIDKRPNNPVIVRLLELPMCTFDQHYTSDNLNHDILTLYY